MWFVRGFFHDDSWFDAEAIRDTLGSFEKVIHFPALYGARMSQAFTATDPSVTVDPEETIIIPDIKRKDRNGREWNFTDGEAKRASLVRMLIGDGSRCRHNIAGARG